MPTDRHGAPFHGDENVLELDSGDSYTGWEMNALNTMEIYTLKGLIVWYTNW